MTIDEAIRHAEKAAEQQMQKIDNLSDIPRFGSSDGDIKLIEKCEECAEQHRQLAEWLRDYKRLLDVTDSAVSLNDRINDLISAIENDECQYWTKTKNNISVKKVAKRNTTATEGALDRRKVFC